MTKPRPDGPLRWVLWGLDMVLLFAPVVSLESCHARRCDSAIELWNGRIRVTDPRQAVVAWTIGLACRVLLEAIDGCWRRSPFTPRQRRSTRKPEASRETSTEGSERSSVEKIVGVIMSRPWRLVSPVRSLRLLQDYRISLLAYAGVMLLLAYYGLLTWCIYTVPLTFTCIESSRCLTFYGVQLPAAR